MTRIVRGSAIALGARGRSIELSFSSTERRMAGWRTSFAPARRGFDRIDPEWRGQSTSGLQRIAGLFAAACAGKLSIGCDYLESIVHKGNLQ